MYFNSILLFFSNLWTSIKIGVFIAFLLSTVLPLSSGNNTLRSLYNPEIPPMSSLMRRSAAVRQILSFFLLNIDRRNIFFMRWRKFFSKNHKKTQMQKHLSSLTTICYSFLLFFVPRYLWSVLLLIILLSHDRLSLFLSLLWLRLRRLVISS